jgi:hypothetical protein
MDNDKINNFDSMIAEIQNNRKITPIYMYG